MGTRIQIIGTAGHAEAPAARLGPLIRAVAGIGPAEPSGVQFERNSSSPTAAMLEQTTTCRTLAAAHASSTFQVPSTLTRM